MVGVNRIETCPENRKADVTAQSLVDCMFSEYSKHLLLDVFGERQAVQVQA